MSTECGFVQNDGLCRESEQYLLIVGLDRLVEKGLSFLSEGMKKTFGLFFSFLFFFLIASPVLGQRLDFDFASPPAALKIHRERVKTRQETIRQQIQEGRTTRTARLSEAKKERIRRLFSRLIKRMRAAVRRLEILETRIESRLDKIETVNEDVDISGIRADLEKAKSNLNQASEALVQAEASLEDILLTDDPKKDFVDVRDLIREIKKQLIEIHRLLVHLIGDIRGLRVGQEE